MADIPLCWRCGASLEKLSLPLGRLDECPQCEVQVHVCRMCVNFDPAVTRACREDDADDIKEKERSYFCDFFKLNNNAFNPVFVAADQQASDALGQLFGSNSDGDGEKPADDGGQSAEDLFK